jgi:hypothetical protein
LYQKVLHSGSDSNKEFGFHVFPKSVLQQPAAAEGVTWPATFLPPADTAPLINGVRAAYPKNLSLRFGAHRASVYGSSATAKNSAFNAVAKDSVKEAHAMEYMARPVSPQILSEEFTDSETLLADMAEDPIPTTPVLQKVGNPQCSLSYGMSNPHFIYPNGGPGGGSPRKIFEPKD